MFSWAGCLGLFSFASYVYGAEYMMLPVLEHELLPICWYFEVADIYIFISC
jgi:hypothetical protein